MQDQIHSGLQHMHQREIEADTERERATESSPGREKRKCPGQHLTCEL